MKKKPKKVTGLESFINVSKERHGDGRFDYSEVVYITAKTKVKLRCIKHDLWFEVTPDSHNRIKSGMNFGGCPECRRKILGQYHKLSVNDFILKSAAVHGNKYTYDKVTYFKNMHTKVTITCPFHGDFEQIPTNHLHNGFGCTECAKEVIAQSRKLAQDEVIERFRHVHGDRYDYSKVDYQGYYTPVEILCKTHNHWFLQNPSDHFTGTGCRLCIDKGFSKTKPAYIYINNVVGSSAIKVGITNICPVARAKVLDRKSTKYCIKPLFYFYHQDGEFIYNLEYEILSKFPRGVIDKLDMNSGYTETISNEYLPEVIDTIVFRFNNYKPT